MSGVKVYGQQFSDDHLRQLVDRARASTAQNEREAVLDELLAHYEQAAQAGSPSVSEIRRAFLVALENAPESLRGDRFSQFLAEQIEPADFRQIHWDSPNQVIIFCELLYSFQSPAEEVAGRIRAHVRYLLRHALQQFEQQGKMEKMFQLLRLAPTTPDLMRDAELLRLRNRVYLYEMRRVRRNRRLLSAFLLLQLLFITVVFPLLFINAENGALQEAIKETTEVELEEPIGRPNYTYLDGLYWALITASSIGYGDITPRTNVGQMIAASLGVMGVVTTGLIAGLILSWIVPRSLD